MSKSIIKKAILVVMLFTILCGCYNYTNWKKVEIPTDTPLKGKIRIPNEWEFVSANGIITLINKDTNSIVADQIFQEWYGDAFIPGLRVEDWNDLDFKSNICDVDIKNQEYYDSVRTNSSGAHVYSFNDGINERLCIFIRIYSDLYNPYYNPNTGNKFNDFTLSMMFDESIELETIQKMAVSYSWGGYIKKQK